MGDRRLTLRPPGESRLIVALPVFGEERLEANWANGRLQFVKRGILIDEAAPRARWRPGCKSGKLLANANEAGPCCELRCCC